MRWSARARGDSMGTGRGVGVGVAVGGMGVGVGVAVGKGVTVGVGVVGKAGLASTVGLGVGKMTGGGIVRRAAGSARLFCSVDAEPGPAGTACLFCPIVGRGVAGTVCSSGVGTGVIMGVAVMRTTTVRVAVSPPAHPASSRARPAARNISFRVGVTRTPFQSRAASRRSRARLATA